MKSDLLLMHPETAAGIGLFKTAVKRAQQSTAESYSIKKIKLTVDYIIHSKTH